MFVKLLTRTLAISGIVLAAFVVRAEDDKYAVFSVREQTTNEARECWICSLTDVACPGRSLMPNTSWPTREQSRASACVLFRNGTCKNVYDHIVGGGLINCGS